MFITAFRSVGYTLRRVIFSQDSVLQNMSRHPTQQHSSRASLTGDKRGKRSDPISAKRFSVQTETLRAFPESGKEENGLLVTRLSRSLSLSAPREEAARAEPSDAAAKPGRRRRGARRWLLPTDTRDFGQLFDPRLAAASFHPHVARDPAFRIPRSASRPGRDWSARRDNRVGERPVTRGFYGNGGGVARDNLVIGIPDAGWQAGGRRRISPICGRETKASAK